MENNATAIKFNSRLRRLEKVQANLEKRLNSISKTLNQLLSAFAQSQKQQRPPLPAMGISGTPANMTVPKAVPNCERGAGIEAETEETTIYFRVHVLSRDGKSLEARESDWFGIALQGANVCTEGYLCPAFSEPAYPPGSISTPVVVGPYIFLIGDVEDSLECGSIRFMSVHYLDTRNKEAGWKEAPSLLKGPANGYFFVVDNKICAVGFFTDTSFSLEFLDCHKLEKGWQSLWPIHDKCSRIPSSDYIVAHTIVNEIASESTIGRLKRHARRALIFTPDDQISYDFNTNKFKVTEGGLKGDFCSNGVDLDGMIYILGGNYGSVEVMAYDLYNRKWFPTPVIGLENELPIFSDLHDDFRIEFLPSTLVQLGKGRLCLVWALPGVYTIQVHCTKFNVIASRGQLCAVNVST